MSIIAYIDDAIKNGKSITIKYVKYSGEISQRTLSNLKYSDEYGDEYIEGYCHLRKEKRTFKISRIQEVDGIRAGSSTSTLGKVKSAYTPNTVSSKVPLHSSLHNNNLSTTIHSSNSISSGSYKSSPNYDNIQKPSYSSYHNTHKSEGCYIATMVYGDYDHPKVIALRTFRDNCLLKSFGGRCFVKFYYFTSPKIVKLLHNKTRINNFIRKWLDRIIDKFII